MGLFSKKAPVATTVPVIPADPQAFAPIPAPAPYRPAISYPADLPIPTTDLQDAWPVIPYNNLPNVPPSKWQKFSRQDSFNYENKVRAVDGIGHTDDPDHTSDGYRAPDSRWQAPSEDLGKRSKEQIGNQDKYTYFRPYDQYVDRYWNGLEHPAPGMSPNDNRTIRQGNYGVRTWRLTQRQDPTSGEAFDVPPPATSSMISEYNAYNTVRRSFRI